MFFVLSGFLITGILLGCRDTIESSPPGQRRLGYTLGHFYARRALRLLPLFYATLLLATLAGTGDLRGSWPWHAGYLSNAYSQQSGRLDGPASHFWSLAVEEQFYLVWPAVVLLTPRRHLVTLMVALVAAAPLARLGEWAATGHSWGITPPACLDALAGGGLLAVLGVDSTAGRRFRRAALILGLVLFVGGLLALKLPDLPPVGRATLTTLWRLGLSLAFVPLIAAAARGVGGPVGWLLACRPLVYLGTVSYGLYVLHNFMPNLLLWLRLRGLVPAGVWNHLPARFVALSLMTIALASLSWLVLERPINRLKSLFPYRPRRDSTPVRNIVPADRVASSAPAANDSPLPQS